MDLKSVENMDFNLALDWMKEEYAKAGGEAKFHLHDAIVFMLKYKKLLEEQPQIVRCKDCKHRPKEVPFKTTWGATETYLDFPKGSKCPCQNSGDTYYSWNPDDNWFCADGEKKEE